VGDPLGLRLATLHNLRFYTQLLDRVAFQLPVDATEAMGTES
jgi:hypothetical protein